ncbi:MAG: DNA-3-methyladenine glycosylase [Bacteroidetes bacterium]|nr:DNA-3-methyladenine glycosylase [Bacteroidota bacterium]
MAKLPISYYLHSDVVYIARSLLGKYLFSNIDNILTGGIITETEAYQGTTDKASHAYAGIRTNRTEIMYRQGGVAYVYLCYGIHYLLNVVTADLNIPHAVLIRAIYPTMGTNEMLVRTGKTKVDYNLSNGPGKLTKAMGIKKLHNGTSYHGNEIWIEDNKIAIKRMDIEAGPRIGVDYAGKDALLPYRFVFNYGDYIKKTH